MSLQPKPILDPKDELIHELSSSLRVLYRAILKLNPEPIPYLDALLTKAEMGVE